MRGGEDRQGQGHPQVQACPERLTDAQQTVLVVKGIVIIPSVWVWVYKRCESEGIVVIPSDDVMVSDPID